MRYDFKPTFLRHLDIQFAPAFIGIGLIVLITAGAMPLAPVVSAMALIALGTTEITIERYWNKATFAASLLVHCLVYGTLYTLFVCVKLENAHIDRAPINPIVALDVLASLVPLTIALRRVLVAFRQHSASQ